MLPMHEHLIATAAAAADWSAAITGQVPELAADIQSARMVWLIGNGGSQACAEHWATDFQKVRSRTEHDPVFVAPAANAPQFTMLANDYGWAEAYAHALIGAREEDLVIALSTSGRSANLIAPRIDWAIAPASALTRLAKNCISGPIYPPGALEDVFSVLGHAITEELRP